MEDAQSAAAKEACISCGTVGLLDGGDGFFYCVECGTQAEDLVDARLPDEDFVAGRHAGAAVYSARHSRPIPVKTVESQSQSQSQLTFYETLLSEVTGAPVEPKKDLCPEDYCNNVRISYIYGLQLMINLQCEALVEKLRVHPLICGIVGSIWLRYVMSTKVFDDGWADQVQQESQSETQGSKKLCTNKAGGKNEPRNIFNKRMVMLWFKALQKTIPLSSSLAITYLSCHIAREAVLPTDIHRWTSEGKLPYLAAFVEIGKTIKPTNECPLPARLMFRPSGVVPLRKLESSAAEIAQTVGLELPPVNFYAIASRYLKQLSLPVEKILPYACHIHDWSTHPDLWLSTCEATLPTRVCVMSILMIAIRILYHLNGFGKWEASLTEAVGSSCTDKDEIEADTDSHETASDQSSIHKLEHEASLLLRNLEKRFDIIEEPEYSKDLESYLRHCKDVVFGGLSDEHIVEKRIIERLWGFYLNNKMGDSEAQEEVRISMKQDDGESKRPLDSASSGASREMRIRLMKLRMEENRFCYIPPRKHIKNLDYLRYARKKGDGSLTYVAHADYYVLLHACARAAQVDVQIMHQGVMSLEYFLSSIEKRVDDCLQKIAA